MSTPTPSKSRPSRLQLVPRPPRERVQARSGELEAGLRPVWRFPSTFELVGELRGNVDLSIDGRVSGRISAGQNHVTIGAGARATADVAARSVLVRGQVVGDITADEKVTVARSASVQGDIRSPRVCLEDGAKFTGRVNSEAPSRGRVVRFPSRAEH
jgi:cytoskeletal protein CcmA (bactofilin family)